MPHKCTKCGREYPDGSTEILKGCGSCGGKKFLYIKEAEIHKDVLEEKSIEEIAQESKEEVLEVVGPKKKKEVEMFDRVETIRILSPAFTIVSTTAASMTFSGTAADNAGVASVKWTVSTGGSGTAAGTTSWSATVPLLTGTNVVTVRAYDAAGNSGWRSVTVVRR